MSLSRATWTCSGTTRMEDPVPSGTGQAARQAQGSKGARSAKAPHGFASNANVKLLRAVNRAMMEAIPQDPSRVEYRQGNTLGTRHSHWRRARIGRRFRLFFRYDARAKVIVYAWMNDERTVRSAGSKTDPYAVFAGMLAQGSPPDDWASSITASRRNPQPERQTGWLRTWGTGELVAPGLPQHATVGWRGELERRAAAARKPFQAAE